MTRERGQRRRWVLSQMSIRSLHPVKQSQLLPQHSHNPFSNNFFCKLLYFTGHLVMFFLFFVKPKKGPMEHLHLSETFSYPSLIGVKLSYLLRVFVYDNWPLREVWLYQIGWFFGKNPNGLRTRLIFGKLCCNMKCMHKISRDRDHSEGWGVGVNGHSENSSVLVPWPFP